MPTRNGDLSPPFMVHWHEGLFLEPHHLQLLQQIPLGTTVVERQRLMHYPYGVLHASISTMDLQHRMCIRFEHLRLLMKTGVEIDFPTHAELPELDITDVFGAASEPFIVSIGVPKWLQTGANVLEASSREDYRANRLYRAADIECRDENNGRSPRTVQIRKVNARLIVPGDSPEGLDLLPLLRVIPTTIEDKSVPRLDDRFVPATLLLASSEVLTQQVTEVINHLRHRRRELAGSVVALGKVEDLQPVRGEVFKKYVRLRLYNRYLARLQHLFACSSITPADMYLELRSFLAELAALEPDKIEKGDVAPYNHDAPFVCFDETCKRLRSFMPGQQPTTERVAFTKERNGMAVQLDAKQLNRAASFYVAVKTSMPKDKLQTLVENRHQFKVAARSEFDLPINPGLSLAWEAPVEIAPENEHFFKIDRRNSGAQWDKVREERVLVARWQEIERSDFQLSLVMQLPAQEQRS